MYKSNFMKCGSQGAKGDDGITPHIGKNGNWYIGEVDSGIKAQGPRGMRGFQGEQGIQGIQGIQGEKGEKGDKGSNVIGYNSNQKFTQSFINDMSVWGDERSYTVNDNNGLNVGDIIFYGVNNVTTAGNDIIIIKVKSIINSTHVQGTTIGSIPRPPHFSNVMVCSTTFEPHTTTQIDSFSEVGHTESFDKQSITYLDEIYPGQQIGLLIPNKDTDNNSLYFGQVTSVTENSIVCDSIGCIHGGIKSDSSVFVVPSNGTFRELKVKVSKRKNTVMANLEIQLATEPNIGEKWFSMPEGFRPINGTSFYTILGGAVVRCAIMPNGDLQMVEKISGEIKLNLDYTVTFNYVID